MLTAKEYIRKNQEIDKLKPLKKRRDARKALKKSVLLNKKFKEKEEPYNLSVKRLWKEPKLSSLKRKYYAYRYRANRKGINFPLTYERFSEFWQLECTYCGDIIKTIGIDRVDSKKGYEEGNMVPCCGMCNRMKLASTPEEFIAHIQKIANNQ